MPAHLHDITKENPPEYFLMDTSALKHVVANITPDIVARKTSPKEKQKAKRFLDFRKFWDTAILAPNPSVVLLPDFVVSEYKNLFKGHEPKIREFDDFIKKIPHIPITLKEDMFFTEFWEVYLKYPSLCVVDILNIMHAKNEGVDAIFAYDQHYHLVDVTLPHLQYHYELE